MNMYEAIKGKTIPLPEPRVKQMMFQVLKSIDHMHRTGIYHRDIKPENILITGDVVKLADFGSCRGIYSKPPFTEYISTRWYRPPECLLTDGYYNHKMDYWGIGCVFYEVLTLQPLFPGTNELDQVHKIHNVLGTPSYELLDGFQKLASHMEFDFPRKKGTGLHCMMREFPEACDMINKLITYDQNHRMTASQAMKHPYFKELRDQDRYMNATPSQMSKIFRMTTKPHESMSVNSKSMSKISDNASEGSLQTGIELPGFPKKNKKKPHKHHYLNMKKGPLATQHSGAFADLKIENSRQVAQGFNSDFESVGGSSSIAKSHRKNEPLVGSKVSHHNSSFMQNQSLLPPIFQPIKKKKKVHGSNSPHQH